MKTKIWLCAIGVALGFYTALAAPACADGYKSPAQIMEFASKLDNQGEKERAIRMYKALVAKYPDSRQAKMAISRIGVLEGRVAEERAEARAEAARREREASRSSYSSSSSRASRSGEFTRYDTKSDHSGTTYHAGCKDGGGAFVTIKHDSPNVYCWGSSFTSGGSGCEVGIGIDSALRRACQGN